MIDMRTAESLAEILRAAEGNLPVIRKMAGRFRSGQARAITPTTTTTDGAFMTAADDIMSAYLAVRITGSSLPAGLVFWRVSELVEDLRVGAVVFNPVPGGNLGPMFGTDEHRKAARPGAAADRRAELWTRARDARLGGNTPYQDAASALCMALDAELIGTQWADWPLTRSTPLMAVVQWITTQGVDPVGR